MQFRLAVHSSVLEAFKSLPALTKARVLAVFRTIRLDGPTALDKHIVAWDREDRFTLCIPRNLFDLELKDGALAKGYYRFPGFDDTFYIESLSRIEGRRCIESGKSVDDIRHGSGRDAAADVVPLDDAWFSEQYKDPFVDRARGSGIIPHSKIPVTRPLRALERFYASPHEVMTGKRVERRLGTGPAFSRRFAGNDCRHMRFGRPAQGDFVMSNVYAHIDACRKRPQTMAIVNFIDECDPYSLAQQEFVYLLIPYLRDQCTKLKIQVLDVVIRDEEGPTVHQKAFRSYCTQNLLGRRANKVNPSAFTMVLGEPQAHMRDDQRLLPGFDGRRLFDFDLFADIRNRDRPSPYSAEWTELYWRYKTVLRRTVFHLFRIAAALSPVDGLNIDICDLRHLGYWQALGAAARLMGCSAVVEVNDAPGSDAFEVAKLACAQAIIEGYPHVVIVLVNRPDAEWKISIWTESPTLGGGKAAWVYDDPRWENGAHILLAEDIVAAYRAFPKLEDLSRPLYDYSSPSRCRLAGLDLTSLRKIQKNLLSMC